VKSVVTGIIVTNTTSGNDCSGTREPPASTAASAGYLRASVSTERKVTKNLLVISLIPEFNGASNTINVYEFTDTISATGKMCAWSDKDNIYTTK
jgi:hypothetical protein